ncbi:putative acetyltransferase [Orientia tsutsugamushi str. UT144]|uniref:Putative acetyltransferase n=1 Tax=Orientia tsutsugamushi str. UT144 TaxID=1441384 RepID=A0A0F3RPL8_ORITS|nr:hypothetical protein [Orientia tsutsugamushi]KJW07881.1 putative acetyltransferase [Orientia tsutsugamushi str. UT144]
MMLLPLFLCSNLIVNDYIDKQPYAFVLSDILKKDQEYLSNAHLANMSKTGHTIALDFGIGNKEYLERGLAAPTL